MEEAHTIEIDDGDPIEVISAHVRPSSNTILIEEDDPTPATHGIVILEPGSLNLRLGFADQDPLSIVHCVAYRRVSGLVPPSQNGSSTMGIPNEAHRSAEMDQKVDLSRMQVDVPQSQGIDKLAQLENTLRAEIMQLQQETANSGVQGLSLETSVCSVLEDPNNPVMWANIASLPPFIVGDETLALDASDGYDNFFPFKNGRFNYDYVHMSSQSDNRFAITLMHVLDSIERIWTHAVVERLQIPKKDLKKFDVVLVVPDSFDQSEVRHMIDILLLKIGFGHILVQQSSICAALGAEKEISCIVNLGFSHTTVACVKGLNIIAGTSFSSNIGGLNVSRFLKTRLEETNQNSSFLSYTSGNIDNSIQDLVIFEGMKQYCCHLNLNLIQPILYVFSVKRRNQPTHTLYRTSIGLNQVFAPMVFFIPELDPGYARRIAERRSKNNHRDFGPSYLPEDHFASQFYKPLQGDQFHSSKSLSTQAALPSEANLNASSAQTPHALSSQSEQYSGAPYTGLMAPEQLTKYNVSESSLQGLILTSIHSMTSDPDRIATMYSKITVVGGSAQIPNLCERIEREIQDILNNASVASPPAIHATLGGTQPINCVWKGASFLVAHAPRSFWLTRAAWQTNGLLALREKLTFSWDNPQNLKLVPL